MSTEILDWTNPTPRTWSAHLLNQSHQKVPRDIGNRPHERPPISPVRLDRLELKKMIPLSCCGEKAGKSARKGLIHFPESCRPCTFRAQNQNPAVLVPRNQSKSDVALPSSEIGAL